MRVYLPVGTRPAEPIVQPKKVARPVGSGTILVVDDDATVRRALARSLGLFGYQAIEAASGAEAVDLYRARRSEIRAVLLDMVMPGMSGRSTYLALREIDPDVSVILMSGYTLNDQVQEILDLGVKAFVTKPHSADHLAELLGEITNPT
jgi:CheY-like chemotaxis protein